MAIGKREWAIEIAGLLIQPDHGNPQETLIHFDNNPNPSSGLPFRVHFNNLKENSEAVQKIIKTATQYLSGNNEAMEAPIIATISGGKSHRRIINRLVMRLQKELYLYDPKYNELQGKKIIDTFGYNMVLEQITSSPQNVNRIINTIESIDRITTGSARLHTVFAVLDYQTDDSQKCFQQAGIRIRSLTSIRHILNHPLLAERFSSIQEQEMIQLAREKYSILNHQYVPSPITSL